MYNDIYSDDLAINEDESFDEGRKTLTEEFNSLATRLTELI